MGAEAAAQLQRERRVVECLAHDIAVMTEARIVAAGPAEQILERRQHVDTRTLLAAVPRLAKAA